MKSVPYCNFFALAANNNVRVGYNFCMSNKPKYWFKRRRYGYGWTPVTSEGWSIVIVFLLVIIASAQLLLPPRSEGIYTVQLAIFFLILLSVLFFTIGISMAKGPVPKWRWGKTPGDNPDEDI